MCCWPEFAGQSRTDCRCGDGILISDVRGSDVRFHVIQFGFLLLTQHDRGRRQAAQDDVQSSDHVIMVLLPHHFDLVPSLPKLILRLF